VEKIYRGTWPQDMWDASVEKKFGDLTKNQLKQRGSTMRALIEKRIAETKINLVDAERAIEQHKLAIEQHGAEFKRLSQVAHNMRVVIDNDEALLKQDGAIPPAIGSTTDASLATVNDAEPKQPKRKKQ
jgi:hypothetical protein